MFECGIDWVVDGFVAIIVDSVEFAGVFGVVLRFRRSLESYGKSHDCSIIPLAKSPCF
jgi:hypothetical protein